MEAKLMREPQAGALVSKARRLGIRSVVFRYPFHLPWIDPHSEEAMVTSFFTHTFSFVPLTPQQPQCVCTQFSTHFYTPLSAAR